MGVPHVVWVNSKQPIACALIEGGFSLGEIAYLDNIPVLIWFAWLITNDLLVLVHLLAASTYLIYFNSSLVCSCQPPSNDMNCERIAMQSPPLNLTIEYCRYK